MSVNKPVLFLMNIHINIFLNSFAFQGFIYFVEDYVCMQFGRVSDGRFCLLEFFSIKLN